MSIHYMNRRVGMQGSQEFITMTVKAIGTVASAPQTLLSGMGRKHWSEMQMVTPPPPHVQEPAMFNRGTRDWFLRTIVSRAAEKKMRRVASG